MIEDTSKRDPLIHLGGAIVDGTSRYITDMEADGQRQLVASTLLPVETLYSTDEDFEAVGFTFGEQRDDLFREATLPEGWKRTGSDHAMWSYIEDERGLERVAIFYKAAFYDRRAHMSLVNVGRRLASELAYWEPNPTRPEPIVPDTLTDAEHADMVEALNDEFVRAANALGYRDDAENRARVERITALLAKHGGAR